jgi:hypothetical protein
MISTVVLIVGVVAASYEAVVRAFPQIDVKYSIIHKILNLLQVLSGALNNKTL